MKQSLFQLSKRRYYILSLIVASACFLAVSYSVPFMETQKFVVFKKYPSLLMSITKLWEQGFLFLAIIIFLFSIIFPVLKLCLLSVVWLRSLNHKSRIRLLRGLELLGKWSMLDVYVVAIIIVLVKAGELLSVKPREGLYYFAASILLSMVATYITSREVYRVAVERHKEIQKDKVEENELPENIEVFEQYREANS